MPNIINVKVPMKSRPAKELLPGDDGRQLVMPADRSTVVVLDITAAG